MIRLILLCIGVGFLVAFMFGLTYGLFTELTQGLRAACQTWPYEWFMSCRVLSA